MNTRLSALAALLLAGTALATPVQAAAGQSSPPSSAATTDDRLRALEDELANVNAQLGDLKRSQSDQYGDVGRQFSGLVQVKLENGRPTFSSADGNFTLQIRALAQLDWAYYSQSNTAAALPAAF